MPEITLPPLDPPIDPNTILEKISYPDDKMSEDFYDILDNMVTMFEEQLNNYPNDLVQYTLTIKDIASPAHLKEIKTLYEEHGWNNVKCYLNTQGNRTILVLNK